jgi:hypothetical protein
MRPDADPTARARRAAALAVGAAMFLLAAACGEKEAPVDPEARVCGRAEAGVGLRVEGRASPVDVCVADDEAAVSITAENYYSITARMVSGGDIFEVQLLFPKRADFPVTLDVTGTLSALDVESAWIYYQEIPQSGDAIESELATAGTFVLGFAADDVVTATLTDISLTMIRQSDGEAAGTRLIEEGFLSVSVMP